MTECMLNQMPLNQAFLKGLLLFRHQMWEDLIFLYLCACACLLYLCIFFYFLKKIIA